MTYVDAKGIEMAVRLKGEEARARLGDKLKWHLDNLVGANFNSQQRRRRPMQFFVRG